MEGIKVKVICNGCGYEEGVEVWDGKRYKREEEVEEEIKGRGWFCNKFVAYCRECKEKRGINEGIK